MLTIVVPAHEYFDDRNGEFIYTKETTLQLEHSLVSLAKWEAKWHKAFLSSNDKTEAEILDYIRCMTINQNVDPKVYYRLSRENIEAINDYINQPMTATTITDNSGAKNKETITAEIIYYWMISFNIPIEFQKWHLNRLLILIKVFSIKNTPPKKMSKSEILRQNSRLNAKRRQALGTKG